MKRAHIFFLLSFLIFSACTTRSAEDEKKSADINPANLVAVEFDVQGMTCSGCENTVKSGISELDGIADVEASFLKAKVLVKFDSTQVNPGEIESSITKKGYKVSGNKLKE